MEEEKKQMGVEIEKENKKEGERSDGGKETRRGRDEPQTPQHSPLKLC